MHRLSAPAVRSLILLSLLSFTTTACSHPAPPPAGDGEPLTVVMWNVESGGANIQSIAEKCCRFDGIDLLGLSEVQDKRWMDAIDAALEEELKLTFDIVLGTTGHDDRLGIIYDTTELELIATEELHDINPGGRVRSPLVARFRHLDSGEVFLFCVNHLYRSRNELRHEQAAGLRDWVRRQREPVILGGDMNFDWSVQQQGRSRDKGFDLLTEDDHITWVRPQNIVSTQDSHYNSILDFIFVSKDGPWSIRNPRIVVEKDDFPDTGWTSDHRPVMATFVFNDSGAASSADDDENAPAQPQAADSKDAVRAALEDLEQSMASLRTAIESLDEDADAALRRAMLARLSRMEQDAKRLRDHLSQRRQSA